MGVGERLYILYLPILRGSTRCCTILTREDQPRAIVNYDKMLQSVGEVGKIR